MPKMKKILTLTFLFFVLLYFVKYRSAKILFPLVLSVKPIYFPTQPGFVQHVTSQMRKDTKVVDIDIDRTTDAYVTNINVWITRVLIDFTVLSCWVKIRGDTNRGTLFGLVAKVDITNDIWEHKGLKTRWYLETVKGMTAVENTQTVNGDGIWATLVWQLETVKGWNCQKPRLLVRMVFGQNWEDIWKLYMGETGENPRWLVRMVFGHIVIIFGNTGWHWTGCWGWHQPLNQPWTPELCLFAWKYFQSN